jgi:hypothetical protein
VAEKRVDGFGRVVRDMKKGKEPVMGVLGRTDCQAEKGTSMCKGPEARPFLPAGRRVIEASWQALPGPGMEGG